MLISFDKSYNFVYSYSLSFILQERIALDQPMAPTLWGILHMKMAIRLVKNGLDITTISAAIQTMIQKAPGASSKITTC